MIKTDQPTIFSHAVKAVFSSVSDGSIAVGGGQPPTELNLQSRVKLFNSGGFSSSRVTTLFITYLPDRSYRDVVEVTSHNQGQIIQADALFTRLKNCPLFLPVADCIATIVYDPKTQMLGLLHLGRHASLAGLIKNFADQVGGNPADWLVWMSPSLGAASNALHTFDISKNPTWQEFTNLKNSKFYLDIPAHNRQVFISLGVKPANIEISKIDTYTAKDYFSHRAANELNQPQRQGRMAAIVMLT